MAKYMVLFSLTGETMKRFVAAFRLGSCRPAAGEVGWGKHRIVLLDVWTVRRRGRFVLPDSHTMAAVSLAATSSGAFTRFESHELIESSDLTAIAEQARGIAYQAPGT